MTRMSDLECLSARVKNPRQWAAVTQSFQQHLRNGRGFWPAVQMDGEWQVIRFADAAFSDRWSPETGSIDIVPLHQIAVTDWPRVQMAIH